MKRLVRYPLKPGGEGGYVVIEVDEPVSEGGEERAGLLHGKIEEAKESLDEALDQIKPAAEEVVTKFRDLAGMPSEIGVQFGIKLGGQVGVVASASIEAQYVVSVKWQTAPQAAPAPQASQDPH